MSEQTQQKFESWCVIELFGHQQLAGMVTEASIGGCSFVRVDVPETNGRPGFTKFYGNGAIYSMTPVGEQEARLALERIMPRPVSVYLLPERKSGAGNAEEFVRDPELAVSDEDDEDSDEDEEDRDDDEDRSDLGHDDYYIPGTEG